WIIADIVVWNGEPKWGADTPPFADRRDRKTLRRLAIHYFLSGEILYRRSFDSTLLRCIDEHESRRLMEEVHGGNCGPHMNCLMLAKKIMRLGYYWSTMETDFYGMEAVLPIEVEIPSMRILAEAELEEAEWAKQRDFASLDFTSAFTALGTSSDFASTLPLSGLHVRIYRFRDFLGLRVHFTAFRTSRPHLLLFGLRVHGLLVHFTTFCGLRPFTYHFTFPKSHSRYYLMIGGVSYHRERR
ncbi:hypothetical protein CRG98_004841, partial [Punica granatum]